MLFFGLYQRYAAGILNHVKEIHFYVLCSKKIKLSDLYEKCISSKECNFTINRIQEIISGYHLVVRQLHYRLKEDNFQNYLLN